MADTLTAPNMSMQFAGPMSSFGSAAFCSAQPPFGMGPGHGGGGAIGLEAIVTAVLRAAASIVHAGTAAAPAIVKRQSVEEVNGGYNLILLGRPARLYMPRAVMALRWRSLSHAAGLVVSSCTPRWVSICMTTGCGVFKTAGAVPALAMHTCTAQTAF